MSTYENVVCPFCGCLCDDIEVTVENGKIVKAKRTCKVALSKFLNHDKNRIENPMIRKNGKLMPVNLSEAVDQSAKILMNSSWPLIYGLASTECDANRKAIELAELIGGVVDNTTSVCHGPTVLGVQDVGEPTATLGEIKNRADLIVFWGCNPTAAHIRHTVRYSVSPKGLFTPEGRKKRTIVTVDVRETGMAKISDIFIKIKPNMDFELLSVLRSIIKGREIKNEDVAGVKMEEIKSVAEKMKACKFGVIFFGLGLTMSKSKYMNMDALVCLVRELNAYTKFVALPMRGHYNVTGSCTVSSWLTGYPYAVDFSRGYPRYNPGEFSAVDVLGKGEADAALIVASDPAASFPVKAARNLAKIPTIVMDPKITMTTLIGDVVIPVAIAGIECEGTAYRMDGVPIRLKKVIDPHDGILPDSEILQMIIDRIRE